MYAVMRETLDSGVPEAALWRESERRRLVRLCAGLSGDPAAAEDLAQETLLEAWRNLYKLRDPAGAERWLSAIARNVCLRWARGRGRDAVSLAALDADPVAADPFDLEVDFERSELAELLDRGLALLPSRTREVLIHRYVHDCSHAEIGARLGLSEDAVSMRLSRGKLVLRSVLGSELHDQAEAYGLVDTAGGGWRPTRVWCTDCGRRRLVTRREAPPGTVSFRCPGCNPDSIGAAYLLDNPFFAQLVGEVVRPSAVLARAAGWSRRYFGAGAGTAAACTRCGCAVRLQRYVREHQGESSAGLLADCSACGEQVSASVRGLASSLIEMRELRRRHPRIHVLPTRRLNFAGCPALAVRYENVLGSSGLTAFFADDTLRPLQVTAD